MDCIFCKIAKGEIPAEVVYEDAGAVGILDLSPRALGHTMVIPKSHAENILGVPAGEVGPLFRAVQGIVGLLERALHPDGFTIGVNHGKASGQAVDHLHVHVIPRWHGDGGGSVHSVVENPPTEPLAAVRKRILAAREPRG